MKNNLENQDIKTDKPMAMSYEALKAERDALVERVERLSGMLTESRAATKSAEGRADALAVENAALMAVFSQKEIPSEAVDAFMETAEMDHDWNETSEWSWVENETDVIHAVLDALKPETPATNAALAAIEARGVEKFAKVLRVKCGDALFDAIAEAQANAADEFAAKLREAK